MFSKFEPQVFHLGKSRPSGAKEKFNVNDAGTLYAWVEKEMGQFLKKLSDTQREQWPDDRAKLEGSWTPPTKLQISRLPALYPQLPSRSRIIPPPHSWGRPCGTYRESRRKACLHTRPHRSAGFSISTKQIRASAKRTK